MWDRYFAGEKVKLDELMISILVCEKFGWTLQEYNEQPAEFIDNILLMIQSQAKYGVRDNGAGSY